MVIVEDESNNYDASMLRTVSIEYHRLHSRMHQYSQNCIENNTMTQICNLMIVPCKQLLCMVIADDVNNNFDDLHIELSPWSIIEYSPEYTNNILKSPQTRIIIDRLPCHQRILT
jgi:hypothetical protein